MFSKSASFSTTDSRALDIAYELVAKDEVVAISTTEELDEHLKIASSSQKRIHAFRMEADGGVVVHIFAGFKSDKTHALYTKKLGEHVWYSSEEVIDVWLYGIVARPAWDLIRAAEMQPVDFLYQLREDLRVVESHGMLGSHLMLKIDNQRLTLTGELLRLSNGRHIMMIGCSHVGASDIHVMGRATDTFAILVLHQVMLRKDRAVV